jgi:DNA-binding winged helix-turn-helix (wHTH) protein
VLRILQLYLVYIISTIVVMEQGHFESLYPDTARFDDIQKIAKFLNEGASCQLLSIPGAGRGTVLHLLANNRKVRMKHFGSMHGKMHFVHVNFSEIRKRPLSDVMKFLFLSLCDSLRARKLEEYKNVNSLFKESLKYKDELVLFQALKEAVDYLCLEKKLKMVFLFDRFEDYIPSVTSEFFGNLRTLRTRAKYQFSAVFSLSRPLEHILDPDLLADFYELVASHHVYLGIRDEVTTGFRISYIEKITGKKVPAPQMQEILTKTGGMGKLVKLSVEAVLSNQATKTKDLGTFLYSQKLIQSALVDICRSLNPSEQTVLIQKKFEDAESAEYLKCIGLLTGEKIQIPLFAQHIDTHRSQSASLKKIVYDENTKTIKKGDSILSDQLTASEYKLLLFLIQNTDRIVSRDEIIDIVWSTVKSTAGITDQAVDQLVFRLRRKIEEDPNTPAHLFTVKGRGFRFIP